MHILVENYLFCGIGDDNFIFFEGHVCLAQWMHFILLLLILCTPVSSLCEWDFQVNCQQKLMQY